MKKLCLLLFSFMIVVGGLRAANDSIMIDEHTRDSLWQQEDFVRAYLVVAEPGGALYSIFGHACLHLICPAYALDYFFTYESEDASKKVLTFLAGQLKMGMAAMTPEDYLESFVEEGRGVVEYELTLPIGIKRELWRVLDEHVMEGIYLPYDFEARGCAYACTQMLKEAMDTVKIEYAEWPEKYYRTRREMCYDKGHTDYPWNMMFIMALVGTDVDKRLAPQDKLIIPTELAEAWQNAQVDGKPLLSTEAHELTPSIKHPTKTWLTPNGVAILLLILAIVGLLIKNPFADWLILALVTLIGVVITYLVVFSTLPCTGWNWLIIPFNIVPALAWKWRQYWALPFAGVVAVWMIAMIVPEHRLVDPSMLIFSVAWVVVLVKNALPLRKKLNKTFV